MIVNSTFLTFLILLIDLYYLFLFLLSLQNNKINYNNYIIKNFFYFILIPAKNEEKVIKKTIDSFLKMKNRNFRLIIINDNSNDFTRDIVTSYLNKDDRVILFDRKEINGKKGKGVVLNYGYNQILFFLKNRFLEPLNLDESFFNEYDFDHIIFGVYDSDAKPDENSLDIVSFYFSNYSYDAVQTLVRIYNNDQGLLAKMQDIEFLGFSRVIQKGRDNLGSVGLGGNGQFAKLSSLMKLGSEPWGNTLTEDLELGLRFISKGMKLGYIDSIITQQEGAVTFKSLLRQRTRWLQGHFTNWKYIPNIFLSNSKIITKIDTIFYLTFVTSVFIISLSIFLSILGLFTIILIKNELIYLFYNINNFLGLLVLLLYSLIFLPLFFYGIKDFYKMNLIKKIVLIFLFALYTYIWVPSFFIAIFRLLLKETQWIKTERFAIEENLEILKNSVTFTNERRVYPRYPFRRVIEVENIPSLLMDYSKGGVGLLIPKFNLNKDRLNIKIEDVGINSEAKIVYRIPINEKLERVGLKFSY